MLHSSMNSILSKRNFSRGKQGERGRNLQHHHCHAVCISRFACSAHVQSVGVMTLFNSILLSLLVSQASGCSFTQGPIRDAAGSSYSIIESTTCECGEAFRVLTMILITLIPSFEGWVENSPPQGSVHHHSTSASTCPGWKSRNLVNTRITCMHSSARFTVALLVYSWHRCVFLRSLTKLDFTPLLG